MRISRGTASDIIPSWSGRHSWIGRRPASSGVGYDSGTVRDRRVASAEPRITSAKPIPIATVNVSLSTNTPSTAATAGLTYVITVARTGPISSMRAAKTRKPAAVGTIARMAIDARTFGDGMTD